jgi:hypothetical protein
MNTEKTINKAEGNAVLPLVSGSLLTGYCCSHCGYKIIENENGDKMAKILFAKLVNYDYLY